MPIPCLSFCYKPSKENDTTVATGSTSPQPLRPPRSINMSHTASAAVAASLASGGVESVGFLNDIIAQLWDYINVAGSKMTKDIVEPMFKEMLPAPLSSLHFVKIDLGKIPIKLDNADVHGRKEGVIKLDIDVKWDGECDIELATSLFEFGVEKVKIAGRMSILLCPLIDRIPLVSAAQIAFVNPPHVELDFTGLAQVADLSVIDKTIRKIIQNVLASILVMPNRLLIKLDPTNRWFDTFRHPLGFVRLGVVSASGFTTPKGFFKDVPDVYCNFSVGAHEKVVTETVNNSVTPEWNCTSDFLLSDHDQMVYVEAVDDDLAGDDDLGTAQITIGKLLLAGKKAELPLTSEGKKETGAKIAISCEIYTLVADVSSFESAAACAKGCNFYVGLVTILVAGAANIPGEKKDAGACVKTSYAGSKFCTPTIVDCVGIDCLNPCFDSAFRVPLTAELAAVAEDFEFELENRRDSLGKVVVKYADVLNAPDMTLSNCYEVGTTGSTIEVAIMIRGTQLAA